MLSDCGADVIKVEAIRGGDVMRGPTGNSRVFTHFNAGKRSIAPDLTQPTLNRSLSNLSPIRRANRKFPPGRNGQIRSWLR